MGLPTPDELKKTAKVSYGLMVTIFGMGIWLGGILVSVLGLDSKLIDEVGGLRNDMNREIELVRNEIENTNKRIDRKVVNHEKIYHKDK